MEQGALIEANAQPKPPNGGRTLPVRMRRANAPRVPIPPSAPAARSFPAKHDSSVHRLDLLPRFDEVIAMEAGRIIARGSPAIVGTGFAAGLPREVGTAS